MDKIMELEGLKDVFNYVGNITTCGRNKKEHDQDLRRLREVADRYRFTFNEEKSILEVEELLVLGYK